MMLNPQDDFQSTCFFCNVRWQPLLFKDGLWSAMDRALEECEIGREYERYHDTTRTTHTYIYNMYKYIIYMYTYSMMIYIYMT